MRVRTRRWRWQSWVPAVLLALFISSCSDRQVPSNLHVIASQNSDPTPQYGLFELTLKHNGTYDNKFFDVAVEAEFISPSGVRHRVKGFYYGGDLWKIRFRPEEAGAWAYSYRFRNKNGFAHEGTGHVACSPSAAEGPIVRSPKNPYRWTFVGGHPYFPVGLQECPSTQGPRISGFLVDGGTRKEGGRRVSGEEYFSLYGQAGFNLYRFSQRNCSYPLFDDLDHYREAEAAATDELLALAHRHGFRVMFGFFGSYGGYATSSSRVARGLKRWFAVREEGLFTPRDYVVAKEKRFIDYCIARWGVYVDFWELLNERDASDEWTTLMADYVHSADPERRPVATSWEKPLLPAIDLNSPHWYESENELQSDLRVQQTAAKWKQAGKPVIVGEQGNSGMNWDPTSAVRMRVRSWTALFQEIALIFWNTSWSKWGMHQGRYTPGGASNLYLGPEERGYIRALQDFASRLDADVRMTAVNVSSPAVRAYGLDSPKVVAAYLHHVADHQTYALHVKIAITQLAGGKSTAEWIDPASGTMIKKEKVPADGVLEAPPFKIDVAVLVRK